MKKIFTILFFILLGLNNIKSATFSSLASGSWTVPATWNVTGVDADGIPDADDDVTVNTGHTVTLSTATYNYFKTLIVQTSATLTAPSQARLFASGNITFQGSLSGTMIIYVTTGSTCNLSSVNPITNVSMWGIYGIMNIASGTTINNSSATAYVYNNAGVNNSGVYNGNKSLTGNGYWNDLSNQAGTFVSIQTGNWNSTSTWSVTSGVDADGLPDSDDDVTVMAGHVVTLSPSSYNNFKNVTVQSGATLTASSSSKMFAYGNATFQGTLSGPIVFYSTAGKTCNFSSSNTITNFTAWGIYGTLNIASGTIISNFSSSITYLYNGGKVNNSGNYKGVLSMAGNGTWNNLANSTLTLTSANGLTSNVSFTAQPNTVVYATTGGSVYPTTFYNLTLNSGSTKTLTANLTVLNDLSFESVTNNKLDAQSYNINVGGNWINNSASSVLNQGTITFNGTSAQAITGTSASSFTNVTLSNSAGLTVNSPSITISDVLTVTNGNFNANGKVTLLSDATKTAYLGTVGASGSFSGSMTIQKYISARAANYHDLSSPVSNSTIMDWDDDLYMSGIGPYDGIVGPAGVDGGAGGDTSVYTYNEPTASYIGVTGSSTPLVVGRVYETFIADDLTSWAARAIDSKGTPNYGSKTINLSYTAGAGIYAGVNLIGNPYASAVNYSACTKTNITGNVLILDNSGSYTDYGSSPVIPPHQGFLVTASGAGASLVFTENSKSTSTTTNFYRAIPNYGIKLVFSSPILPFYNENTINFNDNGSLGYDKEFDALYFKSPNKTAPAVYMLTNTDAKLITNNINTNDENVTIPLALFTPKEGVYYIQPNVISTDNYNYAWIENTKTGKKYELNSSISVIGKENNTNTDYVLRLSKKSSESDVNQTIFDNDMLVFGSENTVNIKATNSTHYLSKVTIYDVSGKVAIETSNLIIEAGHTENIDISNLSSGVYVVSVTDLSGHVKTQKIIR